MKLRLIPLLAVILLNVGLAYGQKHEVGLLVGGMSSTDQEFRPPGLGTTLGKLETGTGLTFQFNYAFRITGGKLAALYAEVPFVVTPNSDVDVTSTSLRNAPRDYSSFFITPGFKFKFLPDALLSPFAAVGGGYARFNESDSRIDGSRNTGQRGTNTGVFDFGGGVDVKLFRYLALRGELRDFVTGRPTFNLNFRGTRQHNIVTSGGIVLRF